MNLTEKDFELINLALDILESDYGGSSLESVMRRQIIALKKKLAKAEGTP